MKKLTSFFIVFLFITRLPSQNPIVPPGVYIADPSAHVWKDGKLYLYGFRDENPNYYCSHSYHILSTSNLKPRPTVSVPVGQLTGVHAARLQFNTTGNDSFRLGWFRFE